MNLRRGLFRLWIIGAALFVIAVASISYPGIKAEFEAVESKPEAVESKPEAGTSTVLAEFRQQYPQYNDLSDDQLADAIYKKFYSDMPREQFNKVAEKIAASKRGKKRPAAVLTGMRARMLGKKLSKSTRQKMSEAHRARGTRPRGGE